MGCCPSNKVTPTTIHFDLANEKQSQTITLLLLAKNYLLVSFKLVHV